MSHRTITRLAELLDVSVVSFPASLTTSAELLDAPEALLPDADLGGPVGTQSAPYPAAGSGQDGTGSRSDAEKITTKMLRLEMEQFRLQSKGYGHVTALRPRLARERTAPGPYSYATWSRALLVISCHQANGSTTRAAAIGGSRAAGEPSDDSRRNVRPLRMRVGPLSFPEPALGGSLTRSTRAIGKPVFGLALLGMTGHRRPSKGLRDRSAWIRLGCR
jgi:hypothetical protein